MTASLSARDDHAVLGEPMLEAQLAEGGRSKQGFEARTNSVECPVRPEGRAQECSEYEVVGQRLEAHDIFERASLRGRLGRRFIIRVVPNGDERAVRVVTWCGIHRAQRAYGESAAAGASAPRLWLQRVRSPVRDSDHPEGVLD